MTHRLIPAPQLEKQIFTVTTDEKFRQLALSEFLYQHAFNPVYNKYCELLKIDPGQVTCLEDIPFLPIDFFKQHRILAGDQQWEELFMSSGTSGMERSHHYIRKLELYRQSFLRGFQYFYGSPSEFTILALLPGYSDNPNSSLIFMVGELIRQSSHPVSGFYLEDHQKLLTILKRLEHEGRKTLLLGVSFALLDLAERYPVKLNNIVVMETGGMKGRREELTREELHDRLKEGFGVERIHSEYGMAEMLSQAYSKGGGKFYSPPWMKMMTRDYYDPFQIQEPGKSGGVNIIDLANLYSCPFIETKDIGRINHDGSFKILGRFDHSDIRGCNLMVME